MGYYRSEGFVHAYDGDFVGQHVRDVFPDQFDEYMARLRCVLRTGKTDHFVYRISNGAITGVRWVQLSRTSKTTATATVYPLSDDCAAPPP